MVSPAGISYVGRSHKTLGKVPAAVAVKRLDLDAYIVWNARDEGAELLENNNVDEAKFDQEKGMWRVFATVLGEKKEYLCRTLVCSDGAGSGMGTKLGLINTPPDGVCSRAFVKGGTHNFGSDGVVFYNKEILPGYAALFRHPKDEVNYCCYLIPGNPKVKNEDLKKWHDFLLNEDPVVKKMLGNNYEIEPMRGAGLRLGGVPVSWMKHGMLIGDAAGLIDPMTGEGIHHAIESGKIAGETIIEAITQGNYDRYDIYHQRWMNSFGFDFAWSMKLCQVAYNYPIVLDAAAAAVKLKGVDFLAKWAEIMTGRVPKIYLFKPEYAIPVAFELFKMLIFGVPKSKTGEVPVEQK
jgi:flavin-dependent dehydrogenase